MSAATSEPSTPAPPARQAHAETEFKLDDLIAFRVVEGECVLEAPADGATVAFAAALLPIVTCFVEWAPLSRAFLRADDDGTPPLADTIVLLRELVQRRVLISREPSSRESRGPDADRPWRDVWAKWDPALAFLLASRTLARQPYHSLAELDELLREKSIREPQPSSYKDYDCDRVEPLGIDAGALDRPDRPQDFVSVLLRRRTCRSFAEQAVPRADIERLIWLTWGATRTVENDMGADVFLRKTSPSGGSLHPTEVYPLIMNVDGLRSGIYHYSVRSNALEALSDENPRDWIVDACGGQPWVSGAAAAFLTSSVVRRVAWKYESPRAFRVVCHDVGHLSQTFYLTATWLGLGAFVTGALRDEIFEQRIGLQHVHEPVLLLNGVGVPAAGLSPG